MNRRVQTIITDSNGSPRMVSRAMTKEKRKVERYLPREFVRYIESRFSKVD